MPRTTRRRVAELILRKHGVFHQLGGRGVRCHVKKGVISVAGHTYRYRCEEEGDTTLIYSGGNARPCFILHIYPDTHTALLADFVNVRNCSVNTDAPAQAAGLAAFALARERGVSHITLVDNSSKQSPSGKKFSVAETSFLTTGKTWYESFLPLRPVPALAAALERWRQSVTTNTWSDVFTCLSLDRPDIQIPVDISDIDVSAAGSAQLVLRRIKSARTDFFADYRYELPKCSGVGSLHGSEWEAYLT
jgi:hypothetical protein